MGGEPQLTVEERDDELVLVGELDIATARQLAAAFERRVAGGHRPIKLNLSAVTFMDSSGLRVLIDLRQQVEELALVDPSRAVVRLLELAAVDHLSVILPS